MQPAMWKPPVTLTQQEEHIVTKIRKAKLFVQEAYELIQSFTTMLRERKGEQLDAWPAQVEVQGISELKSFARGLKKNYDAVKAGLTLPWSQRLWRAISTNSSF
ncbi:transposase [Ktedonobacter racemifer]|uniref:transposase n=1 Tax=Ktedonobacter racemifer TaxID=363277 RepID=UPI0002F88182|nr:transposase [Ktedonobacter racemifer]